MRFQANIHGIDLDKETGVVETEGNQEAATIKKKPMDGFKFGDPDSYKDMPQEEREKLTQQMMARHKAWYQTAKPTG